MKKDKETVGNYDIHQLLSTTIGATYPYLDLEEDVLKELFTDPEEFKKPLRDGLIIIRAVSEIGKLPEDELNDIHKAVTGNENNSKIPYEFKIISREVNGENRVKKTPEDLIGDDTKKTVENIITASNLEVTVEEFMNAAKDFAKEFTNDKNMANSPAFINTFRDEIIDGLRKKGVKNV